MGSPISQLKYIADSVVTISKPNTGQYAGPTPNTPHSFIKLHYFIALLIEFAGSFVSMFSFFIAYFLPAISAW